jgi:hypothetical protein
VNIATTLPADASPILEALNLPCTLDIAEGAISPLFNKRIYFLFHRVPAEDTGASSGPTPSAVVTDGTSTYIFYTIKGGAAENDPALMLATEALGMESPSEPAPAPGHHGYELVSVNKGAEHEIAELARSFASAVLEPGDTFRDARVSSTFDFLSPVLDGDVMWTEGGNMETQNWNTQLLPLRTVLDRLSQHKVGNKNGRAFLPGDMLPGDRKKQKVRSIHAVVFDIDDTPSNLIDQAVIRENWIGVRYTSFNHLKIETQIPKDVLLTFAAGAAIDTTLIRKFLSEKREWPDALVASANFIGLTFTQTGHAAIVVHDPIHKNRLVLFLDKPFDIENEPGKQSDAWATWAEILRNIAKRLGIKVDQACLDVSRLYFYGRHENDRQYEVVLFPGDRVPLAGFRPSTAFADVAAAVTKKGSKSITEEGRALGRWSQQNDNIFGFMIADLIEARCPNVIRGTLHGGFTIECPFDGHHSTAGDPDDAACIAKNPEYSESGMFVTSCRHNSCRDYTMLDMLGRMIVNGWVSQDDLNDPIFNAIDHSKGGNSNATVSTETIQAKIERASGKTSAEDINLIIANIAACDDTVMEADLTKALAASSGRTIDVLRKAVKTAKKDAKKLSTNNASRLSAPPLKAEELESLEQARAQIDLPTLSYGHFDYSMFDGKPWLHRLDSNDNGVEKWTRLCTPISISAGLRYEDKGGVRGQRIVFMDEDGQVVQRDLPVGIAVRAHGSEYKTLLREAGISMTYAGEEFLVSRSKEYTPRDPVSVYDKAGWKGTAFLTAFGSAINTNGRMELAADSMPKGAEKDGSLEMWVSAIRLAVESNVLHFQLAPLTGFASVLIDRLGLPSVVVCYSGETSRGKSTAQEIGASAWGTTTAKEGLFGTFSASPNAAEALMQRGSGCYLALDEFKFIEGEDLHKVIFQASSDSGKDRLNRAADLRQSRGWKLLMTISGELPLAEKLRQSGGKLSTGLGTRSLDLNVEDQPILTKEQMAEINVFKKHFGHAGPAFVRQMVAMGYAEDTDRLMREVEDKASALAGGGASPPMLRAARIVALLWQSGEIAKAAELLPATMNVEDVCRRTWAKALESETAPYASKEIALKVLFENLLTGLGSDVANFDDFNVLIRDEAQAAFKKWSACRVGSFGNYGPVYIVPLTSLGKLAGSALGAKSVAKALADAKALVEAPTSRKSNSWEYIPGLGKLSAVVIKASAVEKE